MNILAGTACTQTVRRQRRSRCHSRRSRASGHMRGHSSLDDRKLTTPAQPQSITSKWSIALMAHIHSKPISAALKESQTERALNNFLTLLVKTSFYKLPLIGIRTPTAVKMHSDSKYIISISPFSGHVVLYR